MSLKPYDVQTISRDVSEIYSEMESAVIDSIVLALKSGDEKDVKRYWLSKLGDAGQVTQGLVTKVKRASGATTNDIRDVIFNSMAYGNQLDRDAVYKATAKPVAKANLNETLFENIREMEEVAKTTLNMTGNALVSSGAEAYRHLVGVAYMKASTGAVPLAQAVNDAINSLGEDGLYIEYESGYRCSVDSAIRRDIVTNINRQVGNQTISNCAYLGYDLVETSYHVGARPDHAVWQGKIFSLSGKSTKYPSFKEATRWGEVDGICGINCRHSFYPFPEEADEMDKSAMPTPEENAIKYKAEQTARAYERSMRQLKRIIHTKEVAGMDSAQVKTEYAKLSRAYGKFCKDNDIARQTFRYSAGGKLNLYEDASLDTLRAEYEEWLKKAPKVKEQKARIKEGEKPKARKTEPVEVKSRIAEKPWETASRKKEFVDLASSEWENNFKIEMLADSSTLQYDRYRRAQNVQNVRTLDFEMYKNRLPSADKDSGEWALVELQNGVRLFVNDTKGIAYNLDRCIQIGTELAQTGGKAVADAFYNGDAFKYSVTYYGSRAREASDLQVFTRLTTSDIEKLKAGGGLMTFEEYKKLGKDDWAYDDNVKAIKSFTRNGNLDYVLGNGNADKFDMYCVNYKNAESVKGLSNDGWRPHDDLIIVDKETGEVYDISYFGNKAKIFVSKTTAEDLTKYMFENMEFVYGKRAGWGKQGRAITKYVGDGSGAYTEEIRTYKQNMKIGLDNIKNQALHNDEAKAIEGFLGKVANIAEYTTDAKGSRAFYSPSEDTMSLGAGHMNAETERGKSVMYHELTHYADNHIKADGTWSDSPLTFSGHYSYTYSNAKWGEHALSKALEEDGKHLSRDAINNANSLIRSTGKEGLMEWEDVTEMQCSILDMAQANAGIYYGTHGSSYFAGVEGRSKATTEFFAEMTQVFALDGCDISLEQIKSLFPNGYEVWQEMLANIKV